MSAQLALDVVPQRLVRDGVWAAEDHQRGFIRLPSSNYGSLGKEGDVLPAWVCCRCGEVELGLYVLELNHGCCVHWRGQHGICTRMGYGRPRPTTLNTCWLPVRPP